MEMTHPCDADLDREMEDWFAVYCSDCRLPIRGNIYGDDFCRDCFTAQAKVRGDWFPGCEEND